MATPQKGVTKVPIVSPPVVNSKIRQKPATPVATPIKSTPEPKKSKVAEVIVESQPEDAMAEGEAATESWPNQWDMEVPHVFSNHYHSRYDGMICIHIPNYTYM